LTRPDGQKLVIGRAAPNGKFALAGAPAGAKPGPAAGGKTPRNNDTTLGEPAVMLASLDLEDVAPAGQDPIPEKGVVAAHYRTFYGLAVDLRIIERGKTAWIAVNATGSGKAAAEAQAIERRVGRWIYAIPSYKADLLRAPLAPPAKS
jgi:hypothetical protein